MTYTKQNPPTNPWQTLVARSIHEPGTTEWLESNIENIYRTSLHNIGYWDTIAHLYPTPTADNQWLYDEHTNSCIGYFITPYDNLYGTWSHDYAYRSHFFQIYCDDRRNSYSAGDPPEFVIEHFRDRGKEIVPWEKSLTKDHPILQKAKAECLTLSLNKSIATRIWNQTTLETFWPAWETRKNKSPK